MDLPGIEKPDLVVCIFKKLSLHLQDVVPVDLLDVVSHLQALFLNISSVVAESQEIFIGGHLLEMVVPNLLVRVLLVDFGHELTNDGIAAPGLGLDARLNDFDLFPVGVVGPAIELVLKVDVPEDFNVVPPAIPNQR